MGKVDEFLKLPRVKETFRDRMLKQILELRRITQVSPVRYDDVLPCKSRCCGKRAFDTEQEALDAIVQRTERNRYKPKRAYECENGKWHLTSVKINDWYAKR